MTIHSGGPHILLFERDQQLTALLMSELQLVGYECHAARTAVEVFDAIARFPIRLALVNLAQAAASRREFWVALDAQRRGRGVQVFTFRCTNVAGYGQDDSDERARIVLTDMDVDGMLGIMNLVDAVRSRIPIAPTSTGSFGRVSTPVSNRDSARYEAVRSSRPSSQPGLSAMPQTTNGAQVMSQATAPLMAMQVPPSPSMPAAAVASPASGPAVLPPLQQQPVVAPGLTEQPAAPRAGIPPSSFTDKIRAVIRPNSRAYSPNPEANWVPYAPPPASGGRADQPGSVEAAFRPTNSAMPAVQPYQAAPARSEQIMPPAQQSEETGLAQLSRMAQENAPHNISLRASPIEDVPVERLPERRNGASTTTGSPPAEMVQNTIAATPQLSVLSSDYRDSAAVPAVNTQVKQPDTSDQSTAISSIKKERDELIDAVLIEEKQASEKGKQTAAEITKVAEPAQTAQAVTVTAAPDVPGISEMLTAAALRRKSEPNVTSEDVLLNIVQSLPPMNALPTPATPNAPQAAVLSGRATRSLANVLLDGHLVPQDRLEVAQNIQRMLRGVDMNYQLGEILLMFKLLTPDQLLAASLVSYGMISAVQISALGRIRQELHSMGLEYDLESLLVLFRILTSEQLREVRSSWSG